jgi:hypothetical protein
MLLYAKNTMAEKMQQMMEICNKSLLFLEHSENFVRFFSLFSAARGKFKTKMYFDMFKRSFFCQTSKDELALNALQLMHQLLFILIQ